MSYSPAISIVVAVYNVELWIRRCLNSIINQTFQDFEVILIDDGSIDRSGKICDEYARTDSRFRVFHQNNQGVCSARRIGIKNAIGEYIIHCDPDDWIEQEMLHELYIQAKQSNADVVVCDSFFCDENSQKHISMNPGNILSSINVFRFFAKWRWSLCDKLIRKACFKQYKIFIPEYLQFAEDAVIILGLYQNPITTSYLGKALYHYCHDNVNSLTSIDADKEYRSIKKTHDILSQYLNDPYRTIALVELEKRMATFCLQNGQIDKKTFKAEFNILRKKYRKDNSLSIGSKIIFFFAFNISAKITSRILRFYLELKSNEIHNISLFL